MPKEQPFTTPAYFLLNIQLIARRVSVFSCIFSDGIVHIDQSFLENDIIGRGQHIKTMLLHLLEKSTKRFYDILLFQGGILINPYPIFVTDEIEMFRVIDEL